MTLRTYTGPLRNSVAFIAVCTALVVAPTFAGSPAVDRAVAQAVVQTRVFSCAGLNFQPIDSTTGYEWTGRELYRTTKAGDGWFMCAANLPHRAKVTRVRFTLNDSYDLGSFNYCGLIRTPLTVTGAIQTMAMAVTSTGIPAKPGILRYASSSISFPVVDNANYAYSLQCQMGLDETVTSHSGVGFGLIGADVTYTISAGNG